MEPAYVFEYAPVDNLEEHRPAITEFLSKIDKLVEEYKDESYVKYILVNDNFVLKFLRARKFKVDDAVKLFEECLEHRKKYDLDHILDKPDPVVRFLATRYPHAFVGYEKGGRPLYVENIGDIDADAMAEDSSFEETLHYHRWMQEFLHRKVINRANYILAKKDIEKSRVENTPVEKRKQIDQMVFITNIGGAAMSAMGSVTFLKTIAKEDSIGYPEMLYKTWILNAGFIFKAGYAIAKPFLDPGTTAKFNIFRSDAFKEMDEELGGENLPSFLLGSKPTPKVINFKYFATPEEMKKQATERDALKKAIKKEKKAGTYVEPAPEEKYKLPDVEIIDYDETNPRVEELKKRAQESSEEKSMWMRMTSAYTEEVLFCSQFGLAAFEEKFEPETASLREKARSGDALNKTYTITFDEYCAVFEKLVPTADVEEVSVVEKNAEEATPEN